jgi:hypothetical protein
MKQDEEREPVEGLLERLRQKRASLQGSGRYEPRGEVARGGMGAVLRVFDGELRRTSAMKVMLDARPEPQALGRFLEEAQITGQLEHPGIVPVHELGIDSEGRVFFTMRLVEGRDLRQILALARNGEEGWSTARALGVLVKACEAVAYAHSKGVIHRDLKPGNIMVGRFGEVYVMDWGLAKVLGREEAHGTGSEVRGIDTARTKEATDRATGLATLHGTVLGTPEYMPPEQARGQVERMDQRSDVYSLGAILYELLTGAAPYSLATGGDSAADVWRRVLEGRLEPVQRPDVDPELAAICAKAMQREPAARHAEVMELLEELRAYLERGVGRARRSLARSVAKLSWILHFAWWGLLLTWVLGILLVGWALFRSGAAGSGAVSTSISPGVRLEIRDAGFELRSRATWIDEVHLEDLRGSLTLVTRDRRVSLATIGLGFGMLAVLTYVVVLLRRIFATLRRGQPFAPANVGRIRAIAIVLFLVAAGKVVYGAVVGTQLGRLVESDEVELGAPIDFPLAWILAGAMVLILAQVFRIGAEIERGSDASVTRMPASTR